MAVTLVAGDDWEFRVTLLNPDGSPYVLTGSPVLKWVIRLKTLIKISTADVTIMITDAANGKVSVIVPAAKTEPLIGSVYNYAMRVVLSGITHTPLLGEMSVISDPFSLAAGSLSTRFQPVVVAGTMKIAA